MAIISFMTNEDMQGNSISDMMLLLVEVCILLEVGESLCETLRSAHDGARALGRLRSLWQLVLEIGLLDLCCSLHYDLAKY